MIVNGVDTYESKESEVHNKLVVWKSNAFQQIVLPDYAEAAMLEFIITKNKEEVGRAKSMIKYGQNKKGIRVVIW